jgi:hypothetical protein
MLSLKGIATKMNGLHVATYPAEGTLSFMEGPIASTVSTVPGDIVPPAPNYFPA